MKSWKNVGAHQARGAEASEFIQAPKLLFLDVAVHSLDREPSHANCGSLKTSTHSAQPKERDAFAGHGHTREGEK